MAYESLAAFLDELEEEKELVRIAAEVDPILEIAEITGMKEGTVKAHLFRALQSVRARLEGKQ